MRAFRLSSIRKSNCFDRMQSGSDIEWIPFQNDGWQSVEINYKHRYILTTNRWFILSKLRVTLKSFRFAVQRWDDAHSSFIPKILILCFNFFLIEMNSRIQWDSFGECSSTEEKKISTKDDIKFRMKRLCIMIKIIITVYHSWST